MTHEKRTCPNVGPHWDVIGFQGNDPCTDLNRSMGVFALFQASTRVAINSKTGGNKGLTCAFAKAWKAEQQSAVFFVSTR